MQGQADTLRENNLTTTLSAIVTQVLPGGNLVVEGAKSVLVNSESQTVKIRGIVRRADITTNNLVRSDRIANLELQVNGRGVVADSIKRPNLLYRILLGVLPF